MGKPALKASPAPLSEHAPPPEKRLMVSGTLTEDDAKTLAKAIRTGTIGPTTVYYAGLTAPVISAGMSLVAENAFDQAGLSNYWVFLLSATCAVFAGISWYLIFMRWSYRHRKSRSNETEEITKVQVRPDRIIVQRGPVATHVLWEGIRDTKSISSGLILLPEGASAIFIPRRWFDGKQVSIEEFERRIADHRMA